MFVPDKNVLAYSHAQAALTQNETLFRALVENSSDIIVLLNAQGQVTFVSSSITRIMGYPLENVLGCNALELFHSDDLDRMSGLFQSILQSPRKSLSAEFRLLYHDGSWRWFEGVATNLLDDAAVGAVVGNFRAITERKQAEDALQISEERLRLALDAGNIGVWDWDVQQNVLTWSERVYTLHGVAKDTFTVSFENFMALLHPEDQTWVQEAIEQSLRDRVPYSITLRIVTPQGETRWLTTSASVTYDSNGHPIRMLGATSDITEQKEREQRRDDFIGIASHELKTPLTALKGRAQLLKRRLEKQGFAEAVDDVSKMEEQINRLNRLVTDLLDVSKIQAGRLDYAKEQITLDTFLHDVVETVQQTTATHTLTVHGASHQNISGDSDRLEQVFFNLINNAVKYSPDAENVDIHIATAQDTVTVSIQDYGVGIPKEQQSKIFDRFYRVQNAHDNTFPGLGMGLYISYEIVRRHGGDITVTSAEGQGSTFTVSLPLGYFA